MGSPARRRPAASSAMRRSAVRAASLTRVLAFGPSPLNRRLCRWCIRSIHKHPGGAEIELSVLFVDVRGSTSIAEELAPGEYSKLLARFYGVAAEAIDDHDGIVDKFVGDGALALFIPGFAGSEHAAAAIDAARGPDGANRERRSRPLGPDRGRHSQRTVVRRQRRRGRRARLHGARRHGQRRLAADRRSPARARPSSAPRAAEAGHSRRPALERRTLELRGRERRLSTPGSRPRASARRPRTRLPAARAGRPGQRRRRSAPRAPPPPDAQQATPRRRGADGAASPR